MVSYLAKAKLEKFRRQSGPKICLIHKGRKIVLKSQKYTQVYEHQKEVKIQARNWEKTFASHIADFI